MTTIPRAEIDAVMERYGDSWLSGVLAYGFAGMRRYAAMLRVNGGSIDKAEADELDALADRYEREAKG